MLQTNPLVNSISEDENSSPKPQFELHSFDLLACPIHPGFAVEVFCARENFQPKLLCIKCILDPDISKDIRGIDLIAIRDLITESVKRTNQPATSQIKLLSNESFERSYLEFDRKDYIRVFERHIENQMKKLDRDMERVRESLQKLREQFVHFFSKQTETLAKHDEDIKNMMQEYVIEKDEINKVCFYTVSDLLRELREKQTYKEYEKFIRLLHKKCFGTQDNQDDHLQRKIFELMDEMKSEVMIMKGMKVDTQILDKIREQIDEIKIIDDNTLEQRISPLDSKLEKLIEKLKRSEKSSRKVALGSLTPNHPSKKSLLETLRQKFRFEKTEQPKPAHQPETGRGFEKGNPYLTMSDTKTNESKALWNLGSINQLSNAAESHKPVSPWYEPKIESGLFRSSNPDKTLLESETSDGEKPRTSMEIEEERREQFRIPSRVHESRDDPYSSSGYNQGIRRGSLSGYRASLPLNYQKTREKEAANQEGKGDGHNQQTAYNETPSITQFEESSFDFENSRANMESLFEKSAVQEGTPHYYINQWIDEKLNGFYVFQNSLKYDSRQNTDEFNKFSSQQWFKLPRAERDQYTKVAMEARPAIKEELRRLETADLRDLKKIAHQKIEQVKK